MNFRIPLRKPFIAGLFVFFLLLGGRLDGQSFDLTTLKVSNQNILGRSTALDFGPDGRLYIAQLKGQVVILDIKRNGPADYELASSLRLLDVRQIPNHFDDGTPASVLDREVTGITVAGTATNPVIFVPSSDPRVGGAGGDKNLDTNSGIITRFTWVGNDIDDPDGYWDIVDIVRGLPRSEENHATNGLKFRTINGQDYLIVASGGMTNAGGPAKNFAYVNEYALAAAILSINLTQLEEMPVKLDPNTGRRYIYDLPTLDDPTRPNLNGIEDPNDPGYDGIDVNDPWGGNDGLNQAKIVPDGPVQIFSPGFRNTYALEITESGAVYTTDNGANGSWGGFPENEGDPVTVTNDYLPNEPGSSSISKGESVDNVDHLSLVTPDITTYQPGSFYGGHPNPVRANPGSAYSAGAAFPFQPGGAGLYTKRSPNEVRPSDGDPRDVFRTRILDPADPDFARVSLPVDWPPVPSDLANGQESDWRGPTIANPDGPDDEWVAFFPANTNAIAEYTATNFGGRMQGNLIAGRSGGNIHRIILDEDGGEAEVEIDKYSTQGGNPLGIVCNGDDDPFPGTIWVATFDKRLVILEPNDFVICIEPDSPAYDPLDDYDFDGFTNQDEVDNGTDPCSGASQPDDFDGDGVSNLNDLDDDNDQRLDEDDPFQIGEPVDLPVINELFSNQVDRDGNQIGYLGLALTGLMNNGGPNPNWLNWLDVPGEGPNPNDIMGGAVGAITVNMTGGTAHGNSNNQDKGYQMGVRVNRLSGPVNVESRMLNFDEERQLYEYEGDGELGIFIGDGTQSDFLEYVITKEGFRVSREVNDQSGGNPILYPVATSDRPSGNEPVLFKLKIDPAAATVEPRFRIGNQPEVTLPSTVVTGRLRAALQQDDIPLAVGIIGTSNDPAAEIQGTWDYIKVMGNDPILVEDLPNIEVFAGAPDQRIDLIQFFDDDQGVNNLDFSIVSNADPLIGVGIDGGSVTVNIPSVATSSTVVVRATDEDGNFVEDSFVVTVLPETVVLYRVNAGGPEVTDADGNVFEEDNYFSGVTRIYSIREDVADIADTESDSLYISERATDENNAGMWYRFPTGNGVHQVRLHFAEIYFGVSGGRPGGATDRIFDVYAEDRIFAGLDNLDIYREVGPTRALVVTGQVRVTDGELSLYFSSERDLGGENRPKISAIELFGPQPQLDPSIVLSPISDQRTTEGQDAPNDLVVTATGGTGALTFRATGLPPGIELEPSNGDFYGTVNFGTAKSSPYEVTVTVDDSDADPNDTKSITFLWEVDPAEPFWIDLEENEDYTARHECAFVQAGESFILMGGRKDSRVVERYSYLQDTWTKGSPAPYAINHFQAIKHEGLIWVLGGFRTNSFPDEKPLNNVLIYDPLSDAWIEGPEVPAGRRRGSAGAVVHEGKFYVLGGNDQGHEGGFVPWFDVFDPVTGAWETLPNAPHARDHFHATVFEGKLYAIGGRLSGGEGGYFSPLVPEVDVFDFESGTWSTLPTTKNLPTPRAAAAAVLFNNEIFVIGGEVEENNSALNVVEALNPLTETWATKESMVHPRHGTQAIASGDGIFITAGSAKRGANNQKNMEVYNENEPAGSPLFASTLNAPLGVAFEPESNETFSVSAGAGNQGIYITAMAISGPNADAFALIDAPALPYFLPFGLDRPLEVRYTGTGNNQEATLTLTYNGDKTKEILLTSGDLPDNQAPVVDAGADRQLILPETEILLMGQASDDGLPNGSLQLEWSVVEGDPANVSFSNLDQTSPTVTVTEPGIYRFRLSADDGELSASDEMMLEVFATDNFPALRFNAGGSAYTASSGVTFEAEPEGQPFGDAAARQTTETIEETTDQELFQNFRGGSSFHYRIPVPIGQFRVRLYLAEVENLGDDEEGERTMGLTLEGETRETAYDIYAEAGPATAIVKSYPDVRVTDDTLDLELTGTVGEAVLMAFEILSMGDPNIQEVVTDVENPEWEGQLGLRFSVYPNPSPGPVTLLLEEPLDQELLMRIFTPNGQVLRTDRVPARTKRLNVRLDDLADGHYLIQLIGPDHIHNKWLIKAGRQR